MILNVRSKEAIKTALAMTIAYGIALSMDWDRPYWAGFAVAFISLSTIGQSLNKGAMRMLGTLVALVASLVIIALFAQERWWFMVALSGYVGFCTYMMGVSRRAYFWFLAGFASVIICFDGGTDPINAFDTAVLRAQETGLGVLVYTLVAILLWPTSSRAGFEAATRALVQAQHRLYVGYREAMTGRTPEQIKPDQDTRTIAAQQVQALAQFGATLDSALTDSYEVWELRHQWRRFQGQSTALLATLERWHESRKELGDLDLNLLLPNLGVAMADFERRFAEIERLLAGEALQRQPQAVDLSSNRTRVDELSHFHKAAFALARIGLQRLDGLTHDLFDTVLDIKGLSASTSQRPISPPPADAPRPRLLPDPDSIIAVVRVMASLWMAYLLWIYVEVPGGNGIVSAAGSIGMTLATNPRMPVLSIIKPVFSSIAFAGILYVFVMPQLSSFVGLGSMIFLTTFAIAYLFSTPRQGATRAIGLALFLMIIGVSNQQHYNFLTVADTSVMFLMLAGVLALAAWIPSSAQPEKVFLRLLGRFFRSCEYLMTTMRWNLTMTPTRLDRWRQAFHAREIETLPQKLGAWGQAVDTKVLPGTTPDRILALTTNLQALAYRMQEFMEASANPQAALLVRELLTDVRAFRLKVQEAFQSLSRDPAAEPADTLRERLTAQLEHLEGRIEETMNKAAEGKLSERDSENFYRLLGAFRGVSEAAVAYAGVAGNVDWREWREERF
ncbi:MAG: FUSC family protein [Desulfobacterales bacterium]